MADKAPRRSSNPFVTALAIFGTLVLLVMGSFFGIGIWALSQFQGSLHFPGHSGLAGQSDDFIGHIKLEGMIEAESMDKLLDKIDQLSEMKEAKAIFLEVNSPGGAVVASQELFDRILEVRKTKPVLSYYRDLAASGAYYGTSSSTWILANRGTMVGSIGVIMQTAILKDLFEWAKIKPVTFKTGELKDALNPARDPSPADQAYITKLLTDTHAQFMDDVFRGRNAASRQSDIGLILSAIPQESSATDTGQKEVSGDANDKTEHAAVALTEMAHSAMEQMKDGRVVLGTDAQRMGLIDGLASKAQSVHHLRDFFSNQSLKLVEIKDPENLPDLMELFLERAGSSFVKGLASEIALQSDTQSPVLAR